MNTYRNRWAMRSRRAARKRGIKTVEFKAIEFTTCSGSGSGGSVMIIITIVVRVAVVSTNIMMRNPMGMRIKRRRQRLLFFASDEFEVATPTETGPPVVKQLRRARHACALL